MSIVKQSVENSYQQPNDQSYEQNLEATLKGLITNVYKEIEEDERSLNETVKLLLGDVYNEIGKEECLEHTVGFLVDNVYADLDKESQQRLKKRQLLRKKNLAKRKQKIAKIALKRKQARKEAKLLHSEDAKCSKESCLNQTAKLLIGNVYTDLEKEAENLSQKRRLLRKKISEKRQEKIKKISFKRKQARKEAP